MTLLSFQSMDRDPKLTKRVLAASYRHLLNALKQIITPTDGDIDLAVQLGHPVRYRLPLRVARL